MKLGRNLVAGLASSIWSALIGLAAVPFYLKYLGAEAYGLIGFFVTMQALLQLLDMGMAPTINREVARCSAAGNIGTAGKLLHSLALVYWGVAALIATFTLLLAPLIANGWLQSNSLSPGAVSHAVMLMGLVVSCRWPIGLYQGALVGAQQVTVSSAINMVMATLGSGGAVLVLAFVSRSIEAFFLWHAGVGIVYAVVMRSAAWRVIGKSKNLRFDVEQLKNVWRFTAGMSGIGLTGLVFTQLDKVILSKILSLEEFGHYMLGAAVVSGLNVLISPLFNVIFPRFSMLVVTADTDKLIKLYRLGTRALASVLFPVAMVLVFFSEDLVSVWTGNPAIATSVAPMIAFLAVGTALNGVMYFPYALQLAHGMTWIPLTINLVLMVFLVPMLLWLAKSYGGLGGASAWMVAELVYVLLGPWLTHRYMLKGLALKWSLQDVLLPLATTALLGFAGHYLMMSGEFTHFERIMLALVLAAFTAALLLLTSKQLRLIVWGYAVQREPSTSS